MKFEFVWCNDEHEEITRAKIHGGWFVKFLSLDADNQESDHFCHSLTFVPDPNHEWVIK